MRKVLSGLEFRKAMRTYEGPKIPRNDWTMTRKYVEDPDGITVTLKSLTEQSVEDLRKFPDTWGSLLIERNGEYVNEYMCQHEAGRAFFKHCWVQDKTKDMTNSAAFDALSSAATLATDTITSVADSITSAAKAVGNTTTTDGLWGSYTGITIEHPVYQSEFKPVKEKVDKTAKELKTATEIYQGRINTAEKEISDLWNKSNGDYAILNDKINSLDERERACCDTVDWLVNSEIAQIKETIEQFKSRVEQLGHNLEVHLTPIDCEEAKCSEDYKEDIMVNSMFNFDFGRVSDSVRVSTYGLAIKSVDGRYVSYDAKNKSIMDVEILSAPGTEFVYKMPVAIKDIKVGDVVVHNRVPMYVTSVNEGTLTVVDIREGAEKTIYPVKSPFGFNFVTKVVSLFDNMANQASADAPFGNMLPFMLMAGDKNIDPMMLMLMGQNGGTALTQNPMMMYMLMKDGKGSDMLPFLMMAQTQTTPVPQMAPASTQSTAPQTPNA